MKRFVCDSGTPYARGCIQSTAARYPFYDSHRVTAGERGDGRDRARERHETRSSSSFRPALEKNARAEVPSESLLPDVALFFFVSVLSPLAVLLPAGDTCAVRRMVTRRPSPKQSGSFAEF